MYGRVREGEVSFTCGGFQASRFSEHFIEATVVKQLQDQMRSQNVEVRSLDYI